jgi:hypothetical protein
MIIQRGRRRVKIRGLPPLPRTENEAREGASWRAGAGPGKNIIIFSIRGENQCHLMND